MNKNVLEDIVGTFCVHNGIRKREYDSIENMLIKAIYNKEELCNKLALDGVITSYDISHLNLTGDGIKTYVSYVIDAIGIDSFKKID